MNVCYCYIEGSMDQILAYTTLVTYWHVNRYLIVFKESKLILGTDFFQLKECLRHDYVMSVHRLENSYLGRYHPTSTSSSYHFLFQYRPGEFNMVSTRSSRRRPAQRARTNRVSAPEIVFSVADFNDSEDLYKHCYRIHQSHTVS